jgi:uncharacterized protein YggU (UPF0235/DUF167 family)
VGQELPWSVVGEGVVLTVRLTPRGGRDALEGIRQLADGSAVLVARVRAAPTEGEANAALIKLVAKAVSVPVRDVSLIAGATGRVKRLAIAGNGPALAAALEKSARVG